MSDDEIYIPSQTIATDDRIRDVMQKLYVDLLRASSRELQRDDTQHSAICRSVFRSGRNVVAV
jgi:hypothetical protein